MEFNELMNAFAAKCGLAGVEAEDGCVVLEFNDIPVAFMENDAFESLVLRAVIGAPPPETDGSLAKAMLRAKPCPLQRMRSDALPGSGDEGICRRPDHPAQHCGCGAAGEGRRQYREDRQCLAGSRRFWHCRPVCGQPFVCIGKAPPHLCRASRI